MVLINNFHDTPPKIQIPKIKINLSKHFYTISFNMLRFLCQTHGFEVKKHPFQTAFSTLKKRLLHLAENQLLRKPENIRHIF